MVDQVKVVLATITALALIDLMVAIVLPYTPSKLVAFFEYGRSVPGKIERWQEAKAPLSGNLLRVAWRPEMLKRSAEKFQTEDSAAGPIIRDYGMSFTSNILKAAQKLKPELQFDSHSGPAASPNFIYSMFVDDRPNRRKGDIVLIGLLSSSIPGLASFSNRTWSFEQPAPYTYPIFLPDGTKRGLHRIDPAILSLKDMSDASKVAAFDHQMYLEDGMWTSEAFSFTGLDLSPFARLVRRALAKSSIAKRQNRIMSNPEDEIMPWADVLQRMVFEIKNMCHADGQVPLIVLIQAQGESSAHLLPVLQSILLAENVPYLATEEVASPQDPSLYRGDGHFIPEVDIILAERFLALQRSDAVSD